MTQAVFHIVIAIFLVEIYREFFVKDKKKFTLHYIFLAGIGGILPDIDMLIYWILYFFGFSLQQVHRTFTHSLLLPLALFLFALLTWRIKNRPLGRHHIKLHTAFLMLAIGSFVHLMLDAMISGMIMPLYPVSTSAMGLNLVQYLPSGLREIFIPCLDAGTFILLLIWMEYRHKLSDLL